MALHTAPTRGGELAAVARASMSINDADVDDPETPLLLAGASGDAKAVEGEQGEQEEEEEEDNTAAAPVSGWAKLATGLRTLWQYVGPGALVAVGYMDPGNWATDIAAGSQFGYELLMVVLLSSATAVFMQRLSLRLGVATGYDLAEQCARVFPRPAVWILFVLAQIAVIATDMAEVIGSAIALQLLFGLDLVWGVLVSASAVLLFLFATSRHFHVLEYGIVALVLAIFVCFVYMMAVSQVPFAAMLWGYLPKGLLATNVEALYLAIGIIGATVMPHNLYLHAGVARDHARGRDAATAIWYSTLDVSCSLSVAFIVNSAILAVAAANFFVNGNKDVADIGDAYALLQVYLGQAAATVFAVALLLSGQSSTVTGTVAGQIIAEGFVQWRMAPWLRSLLTRLLAIVPAIVVATVVGDDGVNDLLVLSQVILSFQLPFAIFPLVYFTSHVGLMGPVFVNGRVVRAVGYGIASLLAGLNMYLLVQVFLSVGS
jgi:manganese transport protein